MYKYAFFDLDGTLLPMDTDAFLENYLRLISGHFAHLVEPRRFAKQLMDSSRHVIETSSPLASNKNRFFNHFCQHIEPGQEELLPLLNNFYQRVFPVLGEQISSNPLARQLVNAALDRGSSIVLATNPIFPREAVLERMRWAGVEDLPWTLVTSYEDSYYCKPHPGYYEEIMQKLNCQPEECIYFGNDVDEDLAAASLGIPVVLVQDYLINRSGRSLAQASCVGSLQDVLRWFNKS